MSLFIAKLFPQKVLREVCEREKFLSEKVFELKSFAKSFWSIEIFGARNFLVDQFFWMKNFEREIFLAKILARKNLGNLPDFKA